MSRAEINFDRFLLIGAAVMVALCFLGCYNQKKAVKQINKAVANYPDTTNAIFRKNFPIITTPKPTDSTQYKAYQEEIERLLRENEYLNSRQPDTVYDPYPYFDSAVCIEQFRKNTALSIQYNKLLDNYSALQKICKERPPLRDTIVEKDSSEARYWNYAYTTESKSHAETNDKLKEAKRKIKAKNTELWIWRGLAALFLIWVGWRLANKFKKPLSK